MKLTRTLLSRLYGSFDKAPEQFVALCVSHSSGSSWAIADGILTLTPKDEAAPALTLDLGAYTISTLATYLAAQSGWTVSGISTDQSGLSALVLIDGEGSTDEENGDRLYGFAALLWVLLDTFATFLKGARDQIPLMLAEMATTTADTEWLDLLGSYFSIVRLTTETDAAYGPRIIAEVLAAKGNNVAISESIRSITGQSCRIVDADDSNGDPIYNLFNCNIGYDLLGGTDVTAFTQVVADQVERLRDAGTQLGSVELVGGDISDTVPAAPADSGASLTISRDNYWDGTYAFDGTIDFSGATVSTESL